MNNLGTFYQGQVVSIVISSPTDATDEEKALLKDNDLYLGIYGTNPTSKRILSTADSSVVKSTDEETGVTTLACVLSAKETKSMFGKYTIEMLIKNAGNTFTSPCENIISFNVEGRRISEVINES